MPPSLAIDGSESEDWMVLDLGRYMVHCFTKKGREEVDLDALWEEDADALDITNNEVLVGSTKSNLRNSHLKHQI